MYRKTSGQMRVVQDWPGPGSSRRELESDPPCPLRDLGQVPELRGALDATLGGRDVGKGVRTAGGDG